jgi:cytochrome P450
MVAQIILATAALLLALGVIWNKLLRPLWHLARNAAELVTLLNEMIQEHRDQRNRDEPS